MAKSPASLRAGEHRLFHWRAWAWLPATSLRPHDTLLPPSARHRLPSGHGNRYEVRIRHWTRAYSAAQSKRPWLVTLGFATLVLGVLAFCNLFAVTLASVLFMGALMTIGGAIEMIQAFQIKSRRGFGHWILGGTICTLAGLIALYKPLLAAIVLTLILEFSLVTAGISRAWSGIRQPAQPGRRWMVAAGAISALAGITFVIGWPENALVFLGAMIAVDMTIQGVASIAFAATRKSSA